MLTDVPALRQLVVEGTAGSFCPAWAGPIGEHLPQLQHLAVLGCTLQDARLSTLTSLRCGIVYMSSRVLKPA